MKCTVYTIFDMNQPKHHAGFFFRTAIFSLYIAFFFFLRITFILSHNKRTQMFIPFCFTRVIVACLKCNVVFVRGVVTCCLISVCVFLVLFHVHTVNSGSREFTANGSTQTSTMDSGITALIH